MPLEGGSPGDPREWLRRARSNLARSSQGQVAPDVLFEDACFDAQQAVEKALKALPKGSIHQKEINGKKYYYRVYWDRKLKKNIFEWMGGRISEKLLQGYHKAKGKRAHYRNQIRILKLQVHFLKRVLRAREFSAAEKCIRKAA